MEGGYVMRPKARGPAAFTVLGASGYIGGRMVQFLHHAGHPVYAPRRGVPGVFDHELGHVIFAIGLTADFRRRPLDTMEAHVAALGDVLRCGRFESLTYLSSTRVYGGSIGGAEHAALTVNPGHPGDLYNISKLAGEALCLAQADSRVRVARLSNVFGPGMDRAARPSQTFLAALIREAEAGRILLDTAPQSAKDYVAIEDVERALWRIALEGRDRIYNVASGRNLSGGEIAAALAHLTGCRVDVAPGAPTVIFPQIDTRRIAKLFTPADPWNPASLLDRLPRMLHLRRPMPADHAGEVA